MGAKARKAMEEARRSLEAKKAAHLGPTAPPCDNPECGLGLYSPLPSVGTIVIRLLGGGQREWNVCGSPLRCAYDLAGDYLASTTYAPHPPGRYREA
jgi:hypothetical protein